LGFNIIEAGIEMVTASYFDTDPDSDPDPEWHVSFDFQPTAVARHKSAF
jgi:hypothetical protein